MLKFSSTCAIFWTFSLPKDLCKKERATLFERKGQLATASVLEVVISGKYSPIIKKNHEKNMIAVAIDRRSVSYSEKFENTKEVIGSRKS